MTKNNLKFHVILLISRGMKQTSPHNFPAEEVLKHILKTNIADIYFYDHLVVVEAYEGVTLSYKTGFQVLTRGLKYIGKKPFFYIAHRVNSYSINPTDFKHLAKIPTLRGIAIASPLESGKKNAELEKTFFKKPIEIFESIEEAYQWGMMNFIYTKE